MLKTRVSSKGQITLPKQVRDQLGIKQGTELTLSVENGTIRLEKVKRGLERWYGALADTDILGDLEREHQWEIQRDEERVRRWSKS